MTPEPHHDEMARMREQKPSSDLGEWLFWIVCALSLVALSTVGIWNFEP